MDALDARVVALLSTHPGIPVVEVARRLKVVRATVQARLDKLHARGIVTGIVPRLDPVAMGFPLVAICALEIDQGFGHARAAEELARVPEVVDLYTVTGATDMNARILARSTADLQRVLDLVSRIPGIGRTSTQMVLETHFTERYLPLLQGIVDAG